MARRPLPPPDVPFVNTQTGLVTQVWYDYLSGLDNRKLTELLDISTTAPTNGQVLVWVTATSKWTPAAN